MRDVPGVGDAGRAVSIDGKVVAPADARVSVFDRGFLYGDGVFEVLRAYRGVPFALPEHLARLRRSAERVAIGVPWDDRELRRSIDEALVAAGVEEAYVRLMVTRGSGPLSLDPETARSPLRVVFVEAVNPPPKAAYAAGIAAITVRASRAVDGTAAEGAKVTHYLANLLALREARARGAGEAVFVGGAEQVLEGASSNVFVVRGGKLATPPEQAGILAGITRSHVLGFARDAGVAVEERPVAVSELSAADEVFITSSIRELVPVVAVDGRTVGSGVPGPTGRAMHRALRERAGVGGRPMPWE